MPDNGESWTLAQKEGAREWVAISEKIIFFFCCLLPATSRFYFFCEFLPRSLGDPSPLPPRKTHHPKRGDPSEKNPQEGGDPSEKIIHGGGGGGWILNGMALSVMGAKAYDVLSDLCSPSTPSQKTYAQLATILKDHFAPKKLVIAERYRFHNCTQREGESVPSFAANLKYLAATCQFGAHLSEALRDRLVCGLQSKEIQKKVLTEEHNFDEALKNALSLEAAEKDVAAFSHEGSTPVNKLGKGNRRHFRPPRHPKSPGKGQGKLNSPRNNSHNSTSACLSCGKSGHPRSQCKYREYTCHSCGRSGHNAEACKSKSAKVHKVEEPEPPQGTSASDSMDPFSFSLYNLCTENQRGPMSPRLFLGKMTSSFNVFVRVLVAMDGRE